MRATSALAADSPVKPSSAATIDTISMMSAHLSRDMAEFLSVNCLDGFREVISGCWPASAKSWRPPSEPRPPEVLERHTLAFRRTLQVKVTDLHNRLHL